MAYALGGFLTIIGVLAASDGNTQDIPYFSGTIVGVSVIGILILFWKIQRSIIHPLEDRVKSAEKRERICAWRLQELVLLIVQGEQVTMEVVTKEPPEYLNGDDR